MEEADVGSPDAEMWKLCPEPVLSIEDSTEGKGSGSFGPRDLEAVASKHFVAATQYIAVVGNARVV